MLLNLIINELLTMVQCWRKSGQIGIETGLVTPSHGPHMNTVRNTHAKTKGEASV
jgi:hypothetical protein